MRDLLDYGYNRGIRQATHHITIQVSILGPKTIRDKFIQIYLCDACELSSRRMFAIDNRNVLAKVVTSFQRFYEMSPPR